MTFSAINVLFLSAEKTATLQSITSHISEVKLTRQKPHMLRSLFTKSEDMTTIIQKNNHLIIISQCQYNWTNQILLIHVQSLHSGSWKSVCGGSVQPSSGSLLINLRSFYKSKDRSRFNHFGNLRTKMVETRQISVRPRRRTEVRIY